MRSKPREVAAAMYEGPRAIASTSSFSGNRTDHCNTRKESRLRFPTILVLNFCSVEAVCHRTSFVPPVRSRSFGEARSQALHYLFRKDLGGVPTCQVLSDMETKEIIRKYAERNQKARGAKG